jgi:hypothetical protein
MSFRDPQQAEEKFIEAGRMKRLMAFKCTWKMNDVGKSSCNSYHI